MELNSERMLTRDARGSITSVGIQAVEERIFFILYTSTMLKWAFFFLVSFGAFFIGLDIWRNWTERKIEEIEKSLLERGHDIIHHLPCNSSESSSCNLSVRQDYFERDEKFFSTRGLYVNAINGSEPISVVALKIPNVLTDKHLLPLHFVVDHSQILTTHERLAIAGPFMTSSIPLEAMTVRKSLPFLRMLVLGSGVGTIPGYIAAHAKTGRILVDAVESNTELMKTGQEFFDNSNTSRVTYLNEEMMKMIDHSFKAGIKYDSIHVSFCDPNSTNCPISRPDKLALILSKTGTLSFGLNSDFEPHALTEFMKSYNAAFKICFQVGMTEPIQIIFCSFRDLDEEIKSSVDWIAQIKANAADFEQSTGLNVSSLITVKE